MSEAPNTPTDGGKPAETTNPTPIPSAPETPPAKETDWKAEARKWEDRAKANKEAAEKLVAIEEASKTAEEKTAERTAELESKVKQYESEKQIATWQDEVSEATGVPSAFLTASTKEGMEAQAEKAKPLIAQPAQQQNAQTVSTVGNQPERPSASIPIKDQIAAAEEAGDKTLVATLKAMQLGSTA